MPDTNEDRRADLKELDNRIHPTFDKIFRTTFPAVYEKPECECCQCEVEKGEKYCQECAITIKFSGGQE